MRANGWTKMNVDEASKRTWIVYTYIRISSIFMNVNESATLGLLSHASEKYNEETMKKRWGATESTF